MLKRAVFAITALCCLALFPAGLPTQGRVQGVEVPIVMYHSVCKIGTNNYCIPPATLESDLEFLARHGYHTVSVQSLISYVRGKATLPEKPIVLTFDDGFYNNFCYALPLLEKYDAHATVSVVGSFTEKESGLKKRSPVYSYLNTDELAKMAASGRVELANHSYAMHRLKGRKGVSRLKSETEAVYAETLSADVKKCHELVKHVTGIDMNVFTYPYGSRSRTTGDVISSLGYTAMLTCAERVNKLTVGGEAALKDLGRFNRPARLSTEEYFAQMGIK